MLRAQGIRQRHQEERKLDTERSKVAPLQIILELQYKRYLKLCYWCNEKPLSYGKWLCEPLRA